MATVGEPIRAVAARFGKSGEMTPGPQHNHVTPRLTPLYDALRARVAEQADATIGRLE